MSPRYSPDTAQIQPRYSRDTAQIQPRYSRDTAEIRPRYSRPLVRRRLLLAVGRAACFFFRRRVSFPIGFYSRWDSYARLMQPLAATVPVMSCGGNHEAGAAGAWVSYSGKSSQ